MKPHSIVFVFSASIIFTCLFFGVVQAEQLASFFDILQKQISTHCGWFYVLTMSFFLCFCLFLMFSPFGKIVLGSENEKPEFSTFTWFAMVFSAGMGIGLVFYGVAEPILHFQSPPPNEIFPSQTVQAKNAIGQTLFHWGLHPWACYAVVALSLSYFSYRKKLPLSMRSTLYPFLGEKISGFFGHLIDIMAVVCTLFGVATSLGLGAMQVNTGLAHLTGWENSTNTQMLIIAVITIFATSSVISGVKAGIKFLSECNLVLALAICLFIFVLGPTLFLLNSFVENISIYAATLYNKSFFVSAFSEKGQTWLGDWTVFYWAWWISYSPFVGIFIARISKGRSIREFIFGTIFLPALATGIWFTIFGNTALFLDLFQGGNLSEIVSANASDALFSFLESFPFVEVSSVLAVICVVLFFVTSSDSASLVIATIASGGMEKPPLWQRIFWALLEGGVAISLLYAGGLKALRTASIVSALPFAIMLIFICIGLCKSLKEEKVY